ncbi:hypothetical protein GCM10027430_07620 [Lysobacter tyrosinilyticus]
MDAQSLRCLELGLVIVADTALRHQARGFMGEAATALVGAGLGVLVCVLSGVAHDVLRGWHDTASTSPRPARAGRGKLARLK